MLLEVFSFFFSYILGFIVLISVLVFVHEMGHYSIARLFGVHVESFSIGFGKELWGWTDKYGTRWKVAPIPFGGYVKMKGEMLEQKNENTDNDNDSFQGKLLWQKFLIVFAGPLFNLVFPLIIIFFLAFFAGITNISSKIGDVLEDGPSKNILQKGDVIKIANGNKINTFADLQSVIVMNPDKTINLSVEREGKNINLNVTSGSREDNGVKLGYLGITADTSIVSSSKYNLVSSIVYTHQTYNRVFALIITGVGRLVTGKIKLNEIGGPIKIAQISGDTIKNGLAAWLFFMAMLSINLAILNLLPIPAVDGGHLLLYIIQAVIRRPVSIKIQTIIMQIGFVLLMSLMVLIVLKDIFSFI